MSLDLKLLREVASEATPGPWGPWNANMPFNIEVKKPAPSLSKHDSKRTDYWRYEDGLHVLHFNPKTALELLDKLDRAIKALRDISAPTYGTEFCNTDEENNEILASHFFMHQNIARKAIKDLDL